MKLSRKAGTTGCIVEMFIQDSTSATQDGLTGLTNATAGLSCAYKRNRDSAAVPVALATIAVLGTWETGGFKEVDAVNLPGVYEFHLPNASLASGSTSVLFLFIGATNMVALPVEIELTGWDNQDSVRGGLTALPNVNAAAAGGLPTVDSTNSVKIQTNTKKNTNLSNFEFIMLDADGSLLTDLTVDVLRSIDGGAFSFCTNTPAVEVSNGVYKINLTAADLNGNVVSFRMTADGARDTDLTIVTTP